MRNPFKKPTNHHQRLLDGAENLWYAMHGIKNVSCWRCIIFYNCAIPHGPYVCWESVQWLRLSTCFPPIKSVSVEAVVLTMVGVNICKDTKWPLCWQTQIFVFYTCDSCMVAISPICLATKFPHWVTKYRRYSYFSNKIINDSLAMKFPGGK